MELMTDPYFVSLALSLRNFPISVHKHAYRLGRAFSDLPPNVKMTAADPRVTTRYLHQLTSQGMITIAPR